MKYELVFISAEQVEMPFILRLLRCDLYTKINQWKDSQDAHYQLLETCRSQIVASADSPGAADEPFRGSSLKSSGYGKASAI